MRTTLKSTSDYLSRIWNRQLLVFLFFFALSAAFWVFTAGKEIKEKEFDIEIELVGVPKNVVITTEPPKKISITLRDEVFTLLNYKYNYLRNYHAVINWNDIDTSSGHVKVQTSTLLKSFYPKLHSTTQVINPRPEIVEFYFNYGHKKAVDVIFQGAVRADSAYYIIASDVYPRKVDVYGSREALDTVTGAYIQPINLRDIKENKTLYVHFQPVKGLKFSPDSVRLTITADKLMENNVQVPVNGVNFPAGKSLCTFPPKVTVTYLVGSKFAKSITPESFTIVLNYEDLINREDNRIPLNIKTLPTGVKSVRITPAEVEYIIEEDKSYDSEASN